MMEQGGLLEGLLRRVQQLERELEVERQERIQARRRSAFRATLGFVLAAWLASLSVALSQDFEVRTGASPGTARLQVYDGTPGRVVVTGSNLEVQGANELRLYNSANTFYIAHKAGTVTGNRTFTWPDSLGSSGQVLTTDGLGGLSWSTVVGMPSGTAGQTLRHDGTGWVANSLLYNNGSSVGVGSVSPQAMLHVSSSGFLPVILVERNSSTSTSPRLALVDTSLGAVTAAPAWFIDNRGDNFRIFRQPDIITAGTEFVRVTNTGDVGIGTDAPVSRLHVKGGYIRCERPSADAVFIGTSGVSGEIAVFGWSPAGFAFAQGGVWTTAPKPLVLQGGGGSVGVGLNPNPGYKLDVAGDVNFTGALRVGGNPGTANQVLVSNGAAAPSWTTLGGVVFTVFSTNFALAGGVTRYLVPGFAYSSEPPAQIMMPKAVIRRLRVYVASNGLNTASTVTLRLNGVDTGLSVNIPAGSTGTGEFVSTGAVAVSDGQLISVRAQLGGTGGQSIDLATVLIHYDLVP